MRDFLLLPEAFDPGVALVLERRDEPKGEVRSRRSASGVVKRDLGVEALDEAPLFRPDISTGTRVGDGGRGVSTMTSPLSTELERLVSPGCSSGSWMTGSRGAPPDRSC